MQMQLYEDEVNELIVMEGISPIEIQLEKLVERYNKAKEDLYGNDLEDNINQVDKAADLSSK